MEPLKTSTMPSQILGSEAGKIVFLAALASWRFKVFLGSELEYGE
jgi:hypothetical protein